MLVSGLDHLNLNVQNVAKTVEWYKNVFGFYLVEQGIANGKPWNIIRCGNAMLCLFENEDVKLRENASTLNHFGLRITSREKWEKTIERENIVILYGGPVRWPHSTAWYIQDPMGHEIEVVLWDDDTIQFDPI